MSKKKILWPFDPYIEDESGDKKVIQFLKNLEQHCEIEVVPVYVASSSFLKYSPYIKPSDFEKMTEYIENDCRNYLEKLTGKPEMAGPIVLDNPYVSQSAEIVRFEKYVEVEDPDFIVLSSHGRSGWSRAFLGSFTENFLRRTDVPTFVINSQMDCSKDLSKALLPVDTDEKSQKFIEHFLDQHSLGFVKNLELYHKLTLSDYDQYAWAPMLYSSAGYDGDDIIQESKKAATEYLAAFLEHPLSQKRLSYKVSESVEPVCDAINKEVEELNCGLVALRSQAGPVAVKILGSFTQDVIRSSSVPVLVYPYLYMSNKEKK